MDFNRVFAAVNLDNMLDNLSNMKNKIPDDAKIFAVLKTNGYGTGAVPIARELEEIDYVFGYCTATCDEALELRAAGMKKPILILGYVFPDNYEAMIKNDIRPTIFSLDAAKEFDETASKLSKVAPIHIAIDTGMSRIGFQVREDEADVIKEISELSHVKIEGVFTHFARCDQQDKSYAEAQQDLFEKMLDMLDKRNVEIEYHHSANSAAILEFPRAYSRLVRAGVTLYGMWPSDDMDESFPLKSIMSIHSKVVHVKDLEKGRTISYGGTFEAESDIRVATIPVGYGDGYPRSLSNKGYVLIHGKKAPILGRICMDQMMVDVTAIDSVKVGDEVVLIGKFDNEEITMEELGNLSGRFNYELSCGLGNRRIPHVYFKNGIKVSSTESFN